MLKIRFDVWEDNYLIMQILEQDARIRGIAKNFGEREGRGRVRVASCPAIKVEEGKVAIIWLQGNSGYSDQQQPVIKKVDNPILEINQIISAISKMLARAEEAKEEKVCIGDDHKTNTIIFKEDGSYGKI